MSEHVNHEELHKCSDDALMAEWRKLRKRCHDARSGGPGTESDAWARFSREWGRLERERVRRGLGSEP